MYIKLTRLDNSPIWLNASFVVTVEPRKGGGSVVVPVGDGLDYDVRESPEAVLAMLDGAPAPAVVPVPVSDALAPAPEDVSPGGEVLSVEDMEDEVEKPAAPKKKAKAAPRKKAVRRSKKACTLADEQIERLRRMAPGSVRKLNNTLSTQFHVEDAEAEVKALESRGVLKIDREHVEWTAS